MRSATWFRLRRDRLGWTPCAWQGWAVIGVFLAALLGATAAWGGSSPGRVVVTGLILVALLVGTAALTSESAARGE
jgi:hypothetical protein